MWPDNETDRDFLNFTGVAEAVAEIIIQAEGRPISIGVSGAWGAGKSSMIKLIGQAIKDREKPETSKFIFVEFNAWLYQGYDDARAALLEVIAETLAAEANERKSGVEKAKELLKRVDWLRAAKLTAGSVAALALGLPPVGLLGELYQVGQKGLSGETNQATIAEGEHTVAKVGDATTSLIKPKEYSSPPKEIHAIRRCFEETLSEMGVTLVVLMDDLDRCLPPTTISTLEAIRLFLFLENTAFVIAADDEMIKHAVRQHFQGVDEKVVTSYFDKLIQVPIRVPPLGTQEVRAYMMLLFIENSSLESSVKEQIRVKVCNQLSLSWQGKRVDRAFLTSTHDTFPPELKSQFDTADRLAPLMATVSQIGGNPRLIKRFLNAVSIRVAIANTQGVSVDEKVLAKMLLFERCGSPEAYAELTKAVNADSEGKARFLADWEEKALAGEDLELEESWDDEFTTEWLTVPPRLAGLDLRGVLYVSREHAPLITPEDRLSSDAAEILLAILEHPDMASQLEDKLREVPRPEISIMMERLLDRARQEQVWGTPSILEACMAVANVDPGQAQTLATFLQKRPAVQIKPSIVPKISDQPWAPEVFEEWKRMGVSARVKKAIKEQT